jgi:hypothetical protein
MTVLVAALLAASPLEGVELKPRTAEAFRAYVAEVERKLDARSNFLWCDAARAKAGEILVSPTGKSPEIKVTDGLIHDWVGCAFIPGATLKGVLAMVQDYDHHKDVYQPEVIDSKLRSRSGDDFKIHLRLLKKKVITVVLNTEHDVHYQAVGPGRARSRSQTTRITEVANAGKPDERELPPNTGHGFLWNLNSYWRFEERDGGVFIECQAVSLTRNVPTGLGWLIEPIIRNLPKESLENTLRATRTKLSKP